MVARPNGKFEYACLILLPHNVAMKYFTPFKAGWHIAWKYKRLVVLLYTVILFTAAVIVLPLNSLLQNKAGHSLMLEELVYGFNYTFLNDFKNAYGAGFAPLMQQSLLSIIIFYLCFIFLTAGAINIIQQYPRKYDSSLFWSGGGRYFWQMLRIFIYFLVVQLLLLALFGWIYMAINKGLSLAQLEDDRMIIGTLRWLAPIYLLLAVILLCWQDLVRLLVIKQDSRWIFRPFWQAFHLFRQNFLSYYLPYLCFWAILVICIWLQTKVNHWLNAPNMIAIWGSFFVTQLFLIFRLSIRFAIWGGINSLIPKKNDQ